MSGRALMLASALAATLAALPAGSAGAASWLEMNFYLSGPALRRRAAAVRPRRARCARSPRASTRRKTCSGIPTSRSSASSHIRETAFRPWAANTIPRRFCSGIVEVSDGPKHAIHYSIAEDTGMIGSSWGVEWCVVGLDRNWAYNPACKMARP